MPALLLAQLLRTTATLSVAALVVFLVLRGMRYRSARLNRAAWLVVLLSGWLFVRAAIVVPWYEPPPPSGRRVAVPAGFPIDMLQAGAAPAPVLNEISQLQPNAPAHAPPAGQRRFVLSWPVVGVAVWAIGIVTLIARWLIGYIRFVRRLPLGTPPPPEWRQQWQALLAERPVRRPIRLCITRDIGPLVCRAWGEYRLLAPESLWRELTAAQRAAILRHELAHVARGDLYKSLFVRVLALPHWFNPLAWWAVRHFDECGEWACDDAVRRRGPADAASYARVLLRLGDAAAHGYGAAVGGRRLSSRIQRLLMGPPWEDSTMKKSILVGAMVLLAFAGAVEWRLGFRESSAQAQPQAETARRAKATSDAREDGRPTVDAKLLRSLADAAKGGYEAWEASYDAGIATKAADCYIWSRRWAETERALAGNQQEEVAALKSHRDRMERLFRKIEALHREGVRGGEEEQFYAGKFYLAEAEVWLAAAESGSDARRGQPRKPGEDADAYVNVRIDQDSAIWVNESKAASEKELIALLKRARPRDTAADSSGPRKLKITASSQAPYAKVKMAFDAGKAAGFDIHFATDD